MMRLIVGYLVLSLLSNNISETKTIIFNCLEVFPPKEKHHDLLNRSKQWKRKTTY
jgi:hypothetical protein